jgi:hypothetical protein
MSIPSIRRIETAIRFYWGLLILLGTVGIGAQISTFYRFHPDHIGPHYIPFPDAQLLALGYVLVPLVVLVLAATAAFWRRSLAYAGILFFHLLFLLVPLLSVIIRTHKPRAVLVENWLNIGLMVAALYLLTTPAVRTYFPLAQGHRVELYRYTAWGSLGYAVLGFLL